MDQAFEQLINSEKPVLIDFYLPACTPCEKLVPVLDSVKQSLGSRIKIVTVDVNKHNDLAVIHQIRYVPTVVLFQRGKKLWQQSGWLSKAEIIGNILQEAN